MNEENYTKTLSELRDLFSVGDLRLSPRYELLSKEKALAMFDEGILVSVDDGGVWTVVEGGCGVRSLLVVVANLYGIFGKTEGELRELREIRERKTKVTVVRVQDINNGIERPEEFEDIFKVLENGAKKYGANDWLSTTGHFKHEDNCASMFRHLSDHRNGIKQDASSRLDPLLHLAARAMMAYVRQERWITHEEE